MSDEASPIRILVADDHPIVREGVANLVGGQSDMRVVGEASNGREAIQQFRAHHPDITLMDIQMPVMNGLDALIAIRDEASEARIIMLTTYAGDAQVQRAIKAGARGYLLKSSLYEELLGTIRAVHAGKKGDFCRGLLRTCRARHRRRPHTGGSSGLAADCQGECQ